MKVKNKMSLCSFFKNFNFHMYAIVTEDNQILKLDVMFFLVVNN